jgi:hypothetical protein
MVHRAMSVLDRDICPFDWTRIVFGFDLGVIPRPSVLLGSGDPAYVMAKENYLY